MWRINHQPHRSTFLCRLTLQIQTCRENWGDISASIWWPEFWDLICINLQRPCFQKTVQQLGLIVSYNTATSCSELQDFYITRPLWCLRAQFGLISCCQGQVGFFEDKGGLLYKERKKNMDRGHGEIRCCTESFSLISRSHIRAGFVPSSKYRSECLKSYFGTFFRFFQSGDLACSFSTLLKRRFSSITTTFLLRLEPLLINCNIITPPTHTSCRLHQNPKKSIWCLQALTAEAERFTCLPGVTCSRSSSSRSGGSRLRGTTCRVLRLWQKQTLSTLLLVYPGHRPGRQLKINKQNATIRLRERGWGLFRLDGWF